MRFSPFEGVIIEKIKEAKDGAGDITLIRCTGKDTKAKKPLVMRGFLFPLFHLIC